MNEAVNLGNWVPKPTCEGMWFRIMVDLEPYNGSNDLVVGKDAGVIVSSSLVEIQKQPDSMELRLLVSKRSGSNISLPENIPGYKYLYLGPIDLPANTRV